MDFLSSRKEDERVPRPANIAQQGPVGVAGQVQASKVSSKTRRLVSVVVVALVIVALAVGGWLAYSARSGVAVKKDAYQAVFLTNGQVYFGKLSDTKGDYLSMNNIYYLQVQQAVQPGETKTATPANAAQSSDNVQLVKLGNELHGPDDQMQISQKQVLFWENLKSDGKVSLAIAKYKTDNKQ